MDTTSWVTASVNRGKKESLNNYTDMEATLTLDTKRSLRFKADEFNNLRGFIILQQMNTSVGPFGMRLLIEYMDCIRELNKGETLFCVPAKSACYYGQDLKKVNDRANGWERDKERFPDYKPNWGYAFAIKRTEKGWVYRYVDYKFQF